MLFVVVWYVIKVIKKVESKKLLDVYLFY